MDQPEGIRVSIYDQLYYLRSEEADRAYMRSVASYVDQKMHSIAAATSTTDSYRIAVLAALHITDELMRLRQDHERLQQQVHAKSIQYVALLDDALRR